jgi:hypothetical protein
MLPEARSRELSSPAQFLRIAHLFRDDLVTNLTMHPVMNLAETAEKVTSGRR